MSSDLDYILAYYYNEDNENEQAQNRLLLIKVYQRRQSGRNFGWKKPGTVDGNQHLCENHRN